MNFDDRVALVIGKLVLERLQLETKLEMVMAAQSKSEPPAPPAED